MRKVHGDEATAIYSPKEGHDVVIYAFKFKPEHYREGVELVTNDFPDAQMAANQKRHGVFLKRPSTHELIHISFFDEGESVTEWHESETRMKVVERMRPMLDGPLDVQLYEVAGVIGTTE